MSHTIQKDKQFVWHPFTHLNNAEDAVHLVKGEGAYFYDADGNKYTDYIASWGPMILGHAYEPVVKAIQEYATYSTSGFHQK